MKHIVGKSKEIIILWMIFLVMFSIACITRPLRMVYNESDLNVVQCVFKETKCYSGFRGLLGLCWIYDSDGQAYRIPDVVYAEFLREVTPGDCISLYIEPGSAYWVAAIKTDRGFLYSVQDNQAAVREYNADRKVCIAIAAILFASYTIFVLYCIGKNVYDHYFRKKKKGKNHRRSKSHKRR